VQDTPVAPYLPHFLPWYVIYEPFERDIDLVRKLVLRATHSVLQHFWSDHVLEHSKAMNEPKKKVQMTLKDQSFVNKVKVSFVCNPEDV
jgi:hypothetical protein